jgi:hypothetical protein
MSQVCAPVALCFVAYLVAVCYLLTPAFDASIGMDTVPPGVVDVVRRHLLHLKLGVIALASCLFALQAYNMQCSWFGRCAHLGWVTVVCTWLLLFGLVATTVHLHNLRRQESQERPKKDGL